MHINATKIQIMIMTNIEESNKEIAITLSDTEIKQTEKYNYLVTIVKNRRNREAELKNRLGKARIFQTLNRGYLNNKYPKN